MAPPCQVAIDGSQRQRSWATPVVKVEFQLSGGESHKQTVCLDGATPFGSVCHWSTTHVPDGRYTLQGVAYDAAGKSVRSKPISLSVKNR
jgi:hypothetical protein